MLTKATHAFGPGSTAVAQHTLLHGFYTASRLDNMLASRKTGFIRNFPTPPGPTRPGMSGVCRDRWRI